VFCRRLLKGIDPSFNIAHSDADARNCRITSKNRRRLLDTLQRTLGELSIAGHCLSVSEQAENCPGVRRELERFTQRDQRVLWLSRIQ